MYVLYPASLFSVCLCMFVCMYVCMHIYFLSKAYSYSYWDAVCMGKDACSWPNSHEICNHVGYVALKHMNDSGEINYREDTYPAIYTGPCVDYKTGIRLNTARD